MQQTRCRRRHRYFAPTFLFLARLGRPGKSGYAASDEVRMTPARARPRFLEESALLHILPTLRLPQSQHRARRVEDDAEPTHAGNLSYILHDSPAQFLRTFRRGIDVL